MLGRMGLYDLDFHNWLMEQADAIRRRSANEIDWENLAEEVESLGRSQRAGLRSHLKRLVQHLLKWEHQPERRTYGWKNTINVQRAAVENLLEISPSLKSSIEDLFDRAYQLGRLEALLETGLDEELIPETPEFTLQQAMDARWPDELRTWKPEGGR
jgi:hypothetical protein